LDDLFKKACERNIQIHQYFGINKSLKIEHNSKTRIVYDMLLNHSNIKRVQDKSIVLQWIETSNTSTSSSYSNSKKDNYNNNNNNSQSSTTSNNIANDLQNDNGRENDSSSLSDISDTSDKQNLQNSTIIQDFLTKNNFYNKKSISDISDVSDSILDQNIQEIPYDNPLITESDLAGYNYDPKIINAIYRFEGTDRWGCNHCPLRGDKWFMMKHPCKYSTVKKKKGRK
jgi:hypothetical protein